MQEEELVRLRGVCAATSKQVSDMHANLDFVTRLKDLAEADARAALLDRWHLSL